MSSPYHTFHIPVMGTGHSIDTPIRVAHLGISSVMSLVDDLLLDYIGMYYSEKYSLPFERFSKKDVDGRAKRITAYLDLVHDIVQINMEAIKKLPFFKQNDKMRYFQILPDSCQLKKDFLNMLSMKANKVRNALERELTYRMKPGSIDVNLMVKLDRVKVFGNGKQITDVLSDAKAGVKGYANSKLNSKIVFSAGINQRMFSYMTKFGDFYRDEIGEIKKKIVLKVSDFRSAFVQGKFLAMKGLEVSEYRIESGLNCGGHVFPANGILLPVILKAFKEKKEWLATEFSASVEKYYKKMGMNYTKPVKKISPKITVQGGIGNSGEAKRLIKDFELDQTGWATPFLLVPEATCIDDPTLKLLVNAGKKDLYISYVSPIGVPFNNIRKCGSEIWTQERADKGKPGSPCPKGFLISNREFTENPICLSSRQFQKLKLEELELLPGNNGDKSKPFQSIVEKACICDHLGNGALLKLGIFDGKKSAPQSICPGPNLAWFNRIYTLDELIDHIYGRGKSLVPPERPHMFANEIEIYVDFYDQLIDRCGFSAKEIETLREFKVNLEEGMDYCLEIAKREPYPDENLKSIPEIVKHQKIRIGEFLTKFEKMVKERAKNSIEELQVSSINN